MVFKALDVVPMNNVPADDIENALCPSERKLVREVLHALRGIRFGSVVLTVHDGRLVEIHRTERIRRGAPRQEVSEG